MNSTYFPCFSFPTQVLFLDDNQNFLDGLTINLPSDLFIQQFNNPHRLLEHVEAKMHDGNNVMSRCFHDLEEISLTETNLAIDLGEIHKAIFNPDRFQTISAVVSDYVMPGLNGIEVCERLQAFSLRKILLTGAAGTDLAVEAFNAGLIDQFLMKDSPDFVTKLNISIANNQQQFFKNQSRELLNALTKTTKDTLNCLKDPIFIELVQSLINKHEIIEYYLLDAQGSFLLLDRNAKIHWLAVKNEREMYDLTQYAKFEEAPGDLINQLNNCSHLPCFFTEQQSKIPPGEWGSIMFPTTKLSSDQQTYYYTLIENTDICHLDRDKILSYADFLEQQA